MTAGEHLQKDFDYKNRKTQSNFLVNILIFIIISLIQ